ncbi:DNA-binding protein [Gordonia sp. TBRC 11910]|uniref:DNA-binding protein n=1 Tax=Gordonia asplenii TaxID=2725283 RepID=A0A848L1F7_9ACTN|nr:dihydrofolate reductase family protein [Gordonia asplenii]NMO02915.1 DNA-binding protein [Gordonia asplenii]
MSRPSRVRVDLLNISLDGYAAGTTITLDHPIGGAELLFAHFDGRFIGGVHSADAPITADRTATSIWGQGVGVEIMGRGKFGPQTGPWSDDEWRGWWEDEPPFQTPVIVLTHHPRESIDFANGTTFHFVDASPHEAIAQARELAGDADIRIGGGPSTVRSFLDADLIDFMHLTVEPIVLGEGVSLWEGLGGIESRFDVEVIATRSGLVHQFWNRLGRSGE